MGERCVYYVYDREHAPPCSTSLKPGWTFEEFVPTLFHLKRESGVAGTDGAPDSLAMQEPPFLMCLFWWLFTLGRYRGYYVLDENGKMLHFSYLLTRIYKFPFMKKGALHIGPCWTDSECRGLGIYPAVIKRIAEQFCEQADIYIFTDTGNIASQRGILKAGFREIGFGHKSRFLGVYHLDQPTESAESSTSIGPSGT